MSRITRFGLLFAAAALLGAAGCTNTPCIEAAKAWCDLCADGMSEWEEAQCKCLDEGTLTRADHGSFESDDEAERWCSGVWIDLEYVGDDAAARCRGQVEYYGEWGQEVCPDYHLDDDDAWDDDDSS